MGEKLSRKQALYKDFFQGGASFPGWPGIDGILWSDLEANSGISGIVFLGPGFGMGSSQGQGVLSLTLRPYRLP